mmetsp:Transcript_22068/g.39784  ORF Transcript_22068/g.39784 Transcript_22068/m.39784 type:complete len:159 (-) Transcript_22068:442-918(-)
MPPVTGRLLRQRPVRRLSSSSDPILPMTTRNTGTVVSSHNKRRRKIRIGRNKRSRLAGIISVLLVISVGLILMVDFYKTKSRRDAAVIYCADGVTVGILNDDFCDCLDDGRDEPLTSACSHLLVQRANFSCHDNPSQLVYASRIHDGIFDCHDGSDEL